MAHVGHAAIPPVGRSIDLDWSEDALADLDRSWLPPRAIPELAAIVAEEISPERSCSPAIRSSVAPSRRARIIGRSYAGARRNLVFQYRYDEPVVMLRVFHGREAR